MLRKLIIRTFLVCAALVGVCILGVTIAGFLAFQQPAFYAELLEQDGADAAITADIEEKARDFEEWAMKSVALSNSRAHVESGGPTNPQNDITGSETYLFDVSESQLNALFTSDRFRAGDLRNPRVQILDQQLRLGAQIHLGDSTLVFSADLKPKITPKGALQLEIMNSHLGSLPFPLHTLLSAVSQHGKLPDSKFQLDLSGATPVLTLNISKRGPNSPSVKSVQCSDGNLAIEFQAPISSRPESASDERISNRTAETTQH